MLVTCQVTSQPHSRSRRSRSDLAVVSPRPVPARTEIETPRGLAEAIVSTLGDGGRATWLEPCVGPGAFLKAIHRVGVPRSRLRGLDLNRAHGAAGGLARTRRGVEFLERTLSTRE